MPLIELVAKQMIKKKNTYDSDRQTNIGLGIADYY